MRARLVILFIFLTVGAFAQDEAFRVADKKSPDAKGNAADGTGISVDKYNGKADINLSLGSYTGREMGLPLSISYSTTGIKVDQLASIVGLGWNLNAGGRMTRVVVGVPDEYTGCGGGGEDNYPGSLDFYNVDAPGHQGIYRKEWGNRSLFPIDGIGPVVERTSGYGHNAEYVITTNDGVKYYFGQDGKREMMETVTTGSSCDTISNNYTTTWLLTKIISANGFDEFTFSYEDYQWQNMIAHAGEGTMTSAFTGNVKVMNSSAYKVNQQVLTAIHHNGQKVIGFVYGNRDDYEYLGAGGTALKEIIFYKYQSEDGYKKIVFNQSYFGNLYNTYLDQRLKLDSYDFYGYDENDAAWKVGDRYSFDYINPSAVPAITSNARDYLGLYNGKDANVDLIPVGNNRDYDLTSSLTGTLETIHYPTGGLATIEYEQNMMVGGYGHHHEMIYPDPVPISIGLVDLTASSYCDYADERYDGIHEDYTPSIPASEFSIPSAYMNYLTVTAVQSTLLDLSAETGPITLPIVTSGFGFYAIQSLDSCTTSPITYEECAGALFYPCLRDTRTIFYTPDTTPAGFISGGLTETGTGTVTLSPGKYQVTVWDMDDVGTDEIPVRVIISKNSFYTPEPYEEVTDMDVSSGPKDGFRVRSIISYKSESDFAGKRLFKYSGAFTTDSIDNTYSQGMPGGGYEIKTLSRGYANIPYIHFSKVFEIQCTEDERDNNGYTAAYFGSNISTVNGEGNYPFSYTNDPRYPVIAYNHIEDRRDLVTAFEIYTNDEKIVKSEAYGYRRENYPLYVPPGLEQDAVYGTVTMQENREIVDYTIPDDAASSITKTETASYVLSARQISSRTFEGQEIVYEYSHPVLDAIPTSTTDNIEGTFKTLYGPKTYQTFDNTSITRYLPSETLAAKAGESLETKTKFEYDDQGNCVTVIQAMPGTLTPASYTSTIYGYSNRFPVVSLKGISFSQLDASKVQAIKTASNSPATSANTGILKEKLKELRQWLIDNHPEVQGTFMTYNPVYGITSTMTMNGQETTFEYDIHGRPTLTRKIDPDDNTAYIVSEKEYHTRADDSDQNWVKEITYRIPTTTPITAPSLLEAFVGMNYLDGLGRPIQQTAHLQSYNKISDSYSDLNTHIAYDAFGRQVRDYLPYPTNDTSFRFDADDSATLNYYQDVTNPFSEKVFDGSPLNRILKAAAPGTIEDWAKDSGHEIEFAYGNNSSDAVRLLTYSAGVVTDEGFYADHLLYKTTTTDENENITMEFKNSRGQLVMKRAVDESGTNFDTYYVYDAYRNLVFVAPPKAADITDADVIKNLCYQYKYDGQNRLIEKQLPGKQREYIVYDKLNRIVATGPSYHPMGSNSVNNNNPTQGWLITYYDALGRVVLTGWLPEDGAFASSRDYKQGIQDANGVQNATHTPNSSYTINGVQVNYSHPSLPDFFLLSVNYYDDYAFPHDTFDFSQLASYDVFYDDSDHKPIGLPTATWVRVLKEGPLKGELSTIFYDRWTRPVYTDKKNFLDGYTRTWKDLDFAGMAEKNTVWHRLDDLPGSYEIIVTDMFEYYDNGALRTHSQDIADPTTSILGQILAQNLYDELGRLAAKFTGGIGNNALQEINYGYNIRNWLTDINSVKDLNPDDGKADLFAFKINYDIVGDERAADNDGVAPLYNGNISETYWRSQADNVLRRYGYKYDGLNRMGQAIYNKPDAPVDTNSYWEDARYDENGNITHIRRNGHYDALGFTNAIDNLHYLYGDDSNKLVGVYDATNSPKGFKDNANATWQDIDYTYDANGNLITDGNKGILGIKYNHLNLPTEIIFGENTKIIYIYDAAGIKLGKDVITPASLHDTRYMDGFQYLKGEMRLFRHAEGYVQCVSHKYKYVYNYTDHLGNIRLSYGLNEDDELSILEENHYYPFGLKHTNYNPAVKEWREGPVEGEVVLRQADPGPGNTVDVNYKYKFNGQEWQDELGLNVTAMDFRQYDNAIGRFVCIDKLSEANYSQSPYHFADNNPVSVADPTGLDGGLTGINSSGSQYANYLNSWGLNLAYLNSSVGSSSSWGQSAVGGSPIDFEKWGATQSSAWGTNNVREITSVLSHYSFLSGGWTQKSWLEYNTGEGEDGITPAFSMQKTQDSAVDIIIRATGASMVALGAPMKYFKSVAALGSEAGSSVASYYLSKIPWKSESALKALKITENGAFRVTNTTSVGRFAGRWVPFVGWGLLGYDFTKNIAMPMSEGNAEYIEYNNASGNWIANLPH